MIKGKTKQLPILDILINSVKRSELGIPNLQNIVFVCVQHLLETTVPLFQSLITLGANPKNIFLIGKHYSTSVKVFNDLRCTGIQLQELSPLQELGNYSPIFSQDLFSMWEKVQRYIKQNRNCINAIVVLDDGGRCLEFLSSEILSELPVIGIEQTTAGLFNPNVLNLATPFIDVASCAAKKYLESKIIVAEILDAIRNKLPLRKKKLSCGVVGIGTIGKAVVNKLLQLGCDVSIYDHYLKTSEWQSTVKQSNSIEELISNVDYVFGCTGRDITENIDISSYIKRNKCFISCSSEDKEFLSLLKIIQQTSNYHCFSNDPLNDIFFTVHNNATIHLVKGGFPVNFDRSGETASPHDIQLTRGLLLGAVIQAIATLFSSSKSVLQGRVMLDPIIQQFIVSNWIGRKIHFDTEILQNFENASWIKSNSGGIFDDISHFSSLFSSDSKTKIVSPSFNSSRPDLDLVTAY